MRSSTPNQKILPQDRGDSSAFGHKYKSCLLCCCCSFITITGPSCSSDKLHVRGRQRYGRPKDPARCFSHVENSSFEVVAHKVHQVINLISCGQVLSREAYVCSGHDLKHSQDTDPISLLTALKNAQTRMSHILAPSKLIGAMCLRN
jgi:hypothetical protein